MTKIRTKIEISDKPNTAIYITIGFGNKKVGLSFTRDVIKEGDGKSMLLSFEEAKFAIREKINTDGEIMSVSEKLVLDHTLNGILMGILYASKVISAQDNGENKNE